MFELTNPVALLALVVLVPVLYLGWRGNAVAALRSRLTLLCRIAICALLTLALGGLTFEQPVGREAVVFVADLSASAADSRPLQERFIDQAIAAKHPDDVYAVVGTARQAVVERVLGGSSVVRRFAHRPGRRRRDRSRGRAAVGGRAAAGGVSVARGAALGRSANHRRRGGPGAPARGARRARRRAAAGHRERPGALIDQLAAPNVVHENERFAVRVQVVSNVDTAATVRVLRGDDVLGEQQVQLKPGLNDVTFPTQADTAGFMSLRATVTSDADTLEQNNTQAAVVQVQGPPRVLILEAGRARARRSSRR